MLQELKRAIDQAETPRGMPVKIVAIDGHGGAGKTYLASKLSQILDAEILHTDDFASYDNPLDWWPRMIEEALEPIRQGAESLSYERSSWYKNHDPKPVENQNVTKVIILEGVSASRKEFRPYLTYSIWVEAPKDVYLERGIERDLADGIKSKEQLEADWKQWHSYEEDYIKRDNPQQYANSVVSGTSDYES